MSHFESVFTLVSIVYGIFITILFGNVYKLIRAGNKVEWSWLPILTALYVFLLILKNWWSMAESSEAEFWNSFLIFVIYAFLLLVLYFLLSVVLPDNIPDSGISLKEYYLNHHRVIWACFIIASLISTGLGILKIYSMNLPFNFTIIIVNVAFIGLIITMLKSRNTWVHITIILVLFLELFIEIMRFRII